MRRDNAEQIVEDLLRYDPAVADEVARLRAKGMGWEDIARIALRAAKRIEREVA